MNGRQQQLPGDWPEPEPVPQARRALRRGPRTTASRVIRRRRPAAAPAARRRLAEWHDLSAAEQQDAWAQLRSWVTWLHDRYELGLEERLPRCWAQHSGLIEELTALRAWREEIYQADQPSGQAARYWHTEMRQTIQTAVTFYAAGCRAGHRSSETFAAGDDVLQQRWAGSDPLAGVPAAMLPGGSPDPDGGQHLSPTAMTAALAAGRARPLSSTVTEYARHDGSWWAADQAGWLRVTDPAFAARLDAFAAQMAQADGSAAWPAAARDSPGPDPLR